MTEYFDVFDENMSPAAPFQAARNDVHAQGLWHQTFHCWILRKTEKDGMMLLQLRGALKENNPNKLDISAAGHLQAGEQPMDGLRELEEELGIKADPACVTLLGVRKESSGWPGYTNNEFCHTYFYETETQLEDYKPQLAEVDGLFEISIQDGLKLFSGMIDAIEAQGIVKVGNEYKPANRKIRREDMCGSETRLPNGYYLKIFELANLHIQGQRGLII